MPTIIQDKHLIIADGVLLLTHNAQHSTSKSYCAMDEKHLRQKLSMHGL